VGGEEEEGESDQGEPSPLAWASMAAAADIQRRAPISALR
jgi:hypothetical protein